MTWDGWSRIPNGVTYDAPAAITYDGVMYAYVRGTDNKAYVNGFNGSTWDGWSAIPDGVTPSAPAVTTYDGVMYAYVRGTDNKVYVNKFKRIAPPLAPNYECRRRSSGPLRGKAGDTHP